MNHPDRVSTLLESNQKLLREIHDLKVESRDFERRLRKTQIALAKLASGYQVGKADWTAEDQQALEAAMGEPQ